MLNYLMAGLISFVMNNWSYAFGEWSVVSGELGLRLIDFYLVQH